MCGKAKRIVSAYLSLYLPPFRTLIIILCKWNVCKRFLWGINTTSSQQRHLIITNEPHTLTLLPPCPSHPPLATHTHTLTQYLLLVSNSKSSQTIWPSGIRAETRDESHLAAAPLALLLLLLLLSLWQLQQAGQALRTGVNCYDLVPAALFAVALIIFVAPKMLFVLKQQQKEKGEKEGCDEGYIERENRKRERGS